MKAPLPVPFSSEDDDVIALDSLGIRHFDPLVGSSHRPRTTVPAHLHRLDRGPSGSPFLYDLRNMSKMAPRRTFDVSMVKDEFECTTCRRVTHHRVVVSQELPLPVMSKSLGQRI